MDLPVALATQRDQIWFGIVSQKTSRVKVMNLEMFGRPASLTSPAVAFEDLLPEFAVGLSR